MIPFAGGERITREGVDEQYPWVETHSIRRSGEPEETIPAGLLLGAMPAATEDLLLGRTTPADYKDSVAADGSCQGGGPFGWLRRKQS